MTTATARPFDVRTDETLRMLEESGQYKHLQVLQSPMDAAALVRGVGEVLCFCSNNYLGLANHPDVVEAGIRGLREYGAGTASVRFICGTFEPHETLERTIAEYMGTESAYTFVSCWNATEALFPTFCEAGDIIVSDELNHACIIDSMRLTPAIKKGVHKAVFRHSDMDDCRARLEAARAGGEVTGQIWVVTDGVFSMEGDIARLPELRALCDEFGAMLVADDSHGHGVMGETGRGTHEHYGMIGGPALRAGRKGDGSAFAADEGSHAFRADTHGSENRATLGEVDYFTGTLGKALGGASGGYVAAHAEIVEILRQRSRPYLFSNSLAPMVVGASLRVLDMLSEADDLRKKLNRNAELFRAQITAAGFDVLDGQHPIVPVMIGDAAEAARMASALLEEGVYVTAFSYPVVPMGRARIRVQLSAAHSEEDIRTAVAAFARVRDALREGGAS